MLSRFFLAALAAFIAAPAFAAPSDPDTVFSYQDRIDHNWTNELIRHPLTASQFQRLASKPALVGPEGPVPYQISPPRTIEFLATVPSGGKSTYKFGAPAPVPASDLALEQSDTSIRIHNSFVGIALRKNPALGEGPVESIRLTSGKWIGGSRLTSKTAPTSYSAKIVSDGPVYKEVECRTEFPEGASWILDFRLTAHEPVIVVRETMALGDSEATFALSLSDNFDPDQLFFRAGGPSNRGGHGGNLKSPIKPGSVFVLEPWLRWWVRPEEGAAFSVYRDDSPDLLSVGAGFASIWVDPTIPAEKRTPPLAELLKDDAGLHLDFKLKNGRRQWMIMAPDKAASLKTADNPQNPYTLSPPHALVIKHGQFPLNLVKDYVLDWDNRGDRHPNMLITPAQAAQYRADHAKDPPVPDAVIGRITLTLPLAEWTMTDPLEVLFATGNESVAKYLARESVTTTKEMLDTFLEQPHMPYGSAPHTQQQLGCTPLILDAVLDNPAVSPDLRSKLLARIAFCGYAINRPDFWSEERGFSSLPNMTTSVYGYQVGISSLIPSHPKAREWAAPALAGLKKQLYDYSDENGGWLEAPHYAMVSYDAILGSALMAHNAGLGEMVFDPRLKAIANWFSKWSTPNDTRYAGYRHLPCVGNTYVSEPTSEFGLLASIWKDKDPEFAAQMQWMHHQQKSPQYPGVGGGYPTMAGYRQILAESSVKEKMPPWGTELFPKTGAVLRNNYGSGRESQLLLLAGSFGGWRSHWDDDSGSMTIWGKGRIICDDFGYFNPSSEDHNLPRGDGITIPGIFNISTFAPSKDLDYVSGSRGSWRRQIAHVKSGDPLAPNYFVLSDSFKTPSPGQWTLCFTASKLNLKATGALVEGKDDVDTDVYFSSPTEPSFTTEEKTRKSNAGIRPDLTSGEVMTTQIALKTVTPKDGSLTYVLYPRLKTEKPPIFTSLAGGNAIKVQTDAGTDYIFLSATPFTWQGEGIHFTGTSATVRLGGTRTSLTLAEAGTLTVNGQTLTSKVPISKDIP